MHEVTLLLNVDDVLSNDGILHQENQINQFAAQVRDLSLDRARTHARAHRRPWRQNVDQSFKKMQESITFLIGKFNWTQVEPADLLDSDAPSTPKLQTQTLDHS